MMEIKDHRPAHGPGDGEHAHGQRYKVYDFPEEYKIR
jgi:hypothetical protein